MDTTLTPSRKHMITEVVGHLAWCAKHRVKRRIEIYLADAAGVDAFLQALVARLAGEHREVFYPEQRPEVALTRFLKRRYYGSSIEVIQKVQFTTEYRYQSFDINQPTLLMVEESS